MGPNAAAGVRPSWARAQDVYIPPGTRHSFRYEAAIGHVYNTLVPGGFEHGITEHGTPAPQVQMPPPGPSATQVCEQIVSSRPGSICSKTFRPGDWGLLVRSSAQKETAREPA